jgi:Protein of unknown function (DUF1360)
MDSTCSPRTDAFRTEARGRHALCPTPRLRDMPVADDPHLREAGRPLGGDRDATPATRATKLTLITLFLGVLATLAARVVKREHDLVLKPFDLLMLGLTSFRIGRMIAFEGVAAPLREPFTDTRADGSGAGQTVVASGTGVRRVFGELVACPICLGTWVAAALVYGLHLMPRPTRLLMAVMSTTGVAELVYSVTEALDWTARAARRQCRD